MDISLVVLHLVCAKLRMNYSAISLSYTPWLSKIKISTMINAKDINRVVLEPT